MAIIIDSPQGKIVVDELSGNILDEQALRSQARQTALLSGIDPDQFEMSIEASTGFDPVRMTTDRGTDPQGYITIVAQGFRSSPQSGGGEVQVDLQGNPIAQNGVDTPPPVVATEGETPSAPPGTDPGVPFGMGGVQAINGPDGKPLGYIDARGNFKSVADFGGGAGAAGATAATGASAAVSRQNNIDTLAAQAARQAVTDTQWQETYDYNKAVNDQKAIADSVDRDLKAKQTAEQLDVTRGNTLLGLGSRPDTLIKYLYALQGQQTPQAIGGTTTNLPGYQNVIGQPAGMGAGTSSPSPVPAAGTVSLNLPPQDFGGVGNPPSLTGSTPQGVAGVQGMAAANPALADLLRRSGGANLAPPIAQQGPTQPGALIPQANFNPLGSLKNPLAGTFGLNGGVAIPNDPTTAALNAARDPMLNAGKRWDPDTGQYQYAEGGLIPEKVRGVGMESGQPYEFGEEGTEAVVSNDLLERLMQVAGKVDMSSKGKDGKSQRFSFTLNGAPKAKKNSYAQGGEIGFSGSGASEPPPLGGSPVFDWNQGQERDIGIGESSGYNQGPTNTTPNMDDTTRMPFESNVPSVDYTEDHSVFQEGFRRYLSPEAQGVMDRTPVGHNPQPAYYPRTVSARQEGVMRRSTVRETPPPPGMFGLVTSAERTPEQDAAHERYVNSVYENLQRGTTGRIKIDFSNDANSAYRHELGHALIDNLRNDDQEGGFKGLTRALVSADSPKFRMDPQYDRYFQLLKSSGTYSENNEEAKDSSRRFLTEFAANVIQHLAPNELPPSMRDYYKGILNDSPNGSSVNSYASGGTIGYDPSNTPSLGANSSGFFNNPYLKDVVSRGYNSNPGIPLFPQIGQATNGGQSLIPSVQRLNSLLPSEQSLYAGALQDEFGANAQDAFSMSKQLAPGATGLRTPKFAN